MHAPSSVTHAQRLGVAWVLRQAAVFAVLSLTAVHLAGVVCLAAAERRLARAARATAMEAGLPEVTLRAVRDRAIGTLEREGFDSRFVSVDVYCNGRSMNEFAPLRPGDEVLVTISTPGRASLPLPVGRLTPWLADEDLVGEAKIVVP